MHNFVREAQYCKVPADLCQYTTRCKIFSELTFDFFRTNCRSPYHYLPTRHPRPSQDPRTARETDMPLHPCHSCQDNRVREAPDKGDGRSEGIEVFDQSCHQWHPAEIDNMHRRHLENRWLRTP